MKKIFTITSALALSLCSSLVMARKGPDAMITVGVTVGGSTFPHFEPVVGGKGTAINNTYRLVAKAYSKHNGGALIKIDSSTYNYSNGRGSLIDIANPNNDENILFDNSYTYTYDAQVADYNNRLFRQQVFVDNQITSLTYRPWKNTTAGWVFKDSVRYSYAYATDGRMIESTSSVWFGNIWTNDVSSKISYNSNGIESMTSITYEVNFTYDANKNIETIVDKKWNGSFLENSERKSYTYTGKEVATYELEVWDISSNSWVKTSKWEYTYVTGSTRLDVVLESKYINGAWVLYSKTTHDYDVNNDLTAETIALWDVNTQSYVNSKRERWEYTMSGQPNEYISETWTQGIGWHQVAGDEHIRFYYEHYFPTSVHTVANANDLNIFPIPATSSVNIDWDNHSDYSVAIVDMMGKVVYNKSNITDAQSLSVQNLPNGNYLVKVYDDASQLSKQIVVAH